MHPLSFHRKPLLWCALAVAVAASVAFAIWPREPAYEGKPLSYWLDQLPTLVVSPSGQPRMGHLQYVRFSNRPTPAEQTSLFQSRSAPPSVSNLQFFPYLDEFHRSQVIFQHPTPPRADSFIILPQRPQYPARFQFSQVSGNPQQARALFAVVALDDKCLPTLVRRLQAWDGDDAISRWARAVRKWAINRHLMQAGPVRPPANVRRGQAALAIVKLGEVAEPILPRVVSLAKMNRAPGIRASALDVLRCLSPADYAKLTAQTNVQNELEPPITW